MRYFYYFVVIFYIGLSTFSGSCDKKHEDQENSLDRISKNEQHVSDQKNDNTFFDKNLENIQYYTWVDDALLRAEPDQNGAILRTLPKRTQVIATGQHTRHKLQVTLRGIEFNLPWLQVKTIDGFEGWINYALLNNPRFFAEHIKNPVDTDISVSYASIWISDDTESNKTKASITAMFDIEPAVGNEATILPVRTDLPARNFKITRVKYREDMEEYTWAGVGLWEAEIGTIQDPIYLSIDKPPHIEPKLWHSVFVLYPVNHNARVLDHSIFDESKYPVTVYEKAVLAVIDLTGNNEPDLLITEFDWKVPYIADQRPSGYTAAVYYQKIDEKWQIIKIIIPI